MNNVITIVTPSLNQGKFLEQTIVSVINQAGDFSIDYIIADGGSTDNSLEIIQKYEKLIKNKDFPIRCSSINYHWQSSPDGGQSRALNRAFAQAEGDILAWINSDDYFEPEAFAAVARCFGEDPGLDLFYGNCHEFDSTNRIIIRNSEEPDFDKLLKVTNYISQPAAFFSKKIFIAVGGLDNNLRYAMDYDLWLKILLRGKALRTDQLLANFRYWSDSKSNAEGDKLEREVEAVRKKYGGNFFNYINLRRYLGRLNPWHRRR